MPPGVMVSLDEYGCVGTAEGLDHQPQVLVGGRLGHRDLHRVIAVGPQVDPPVASRRDNRPRPSRHDGADGVEEQAVLDLDSGIGQPVREFPRLTLHALAIRCSPSGPW